MITLNHLLQHQIFDQFDLLTAKGALQREVKHISLLETPDFEKYLIPKSLILTTLYPIKSDVSLFENLLDVLIEKDVSGLVIKLKRYVDVIPSSILDRAEKLGLPIISLTYDANLSTLSSRILNEIALDSLRSLSSSSMYLDWVQRLDEDPSIETILALKKQMNDVTFSIFDHDKNDRYDASPEWSDFAERFFLSTEPYTKMDDFFVVKDVIHLSNKHLFTVILFSKEDQQGLLYYYSEMIKMMLVFLYQRKQEQSLQQNQFLLELISTSHILEGREQEFTKKTELYHWDVHFPLTMVLVHLDHLNAKSQDIRIESIRQIFMNHFDLDKKQIRYLQLNQNIVFLFSQPVGISIELKLRHIISEFEKFNQGQWMKIAYKEKLESFAAISKSYATLLRGMNLILERRTREKIFNDQSVKMLGLLANISQADLQDYVQTSLHEVLLYEKKHGVPLLDTMYTLINHQFNLKTAAEELFIHYNTLRHRIQILETLGFAREDLKNNHFDLIFAIYLAKNLSL